MACCLLSTQVPWAYAGIPADMIARARTCGVFSGTLDGIESSLVDGSLSEADGTQLVSLLISVCEAKLPLAPFEDKLAEGLAKKVSPPFIVRALDKKFDEYLFARELLQASGEVVAPQLLIVLGEGLSKGVPRDHFEKYVSSYAGQAEESFLAGMEMTSLLSQAGFDYQLTQSMLDAGFSSGGIPSQWRYFIRIVLVARQRGESDVAIAKAAKTVLADGGSLADVSSLLGFTSRDLTGRGISN